MKTLTLVLTALVLSLGGSFYTASAGTQYTPSLGSGVANDQFVCVARNISGSPISVTITIYDTFGAVVEGPTALSIPAKAAGLIVVNTTIATLYSCEFSTEIKSKIRANGFVYDTAGNRISATVAAR
jgi:hypothetical protein